MNSFELLEVRSSQSDLKSMELLFIYWPSSRIAPPLMVFSTIHFLSLLSGTMADSSTGRDAGIAERLQHLIGAIHLLQKMVGNAEQSWIEDSANAARTSDPSVSKNVYIAAVKNLYDTTTKCMFH